MRDALRNVTGVSLAAGEGGSQGDNLTLRGFSARNDFYLDGMRDFGSYYRDPFYLESIEVLKGPGSILFGRGSTGGVIEQNSKLPTLDGFTAGSVVLGTDATKRATLDYDRALPELAPGAALRINLMAHDSGVAGRDLDENSRFGLAPTLSLGLGTPTRLTVSYLHQQEYDVPDYGLPVFNQAAPGTKGNVISYPAPVAQSSYYGVKGADYLRTGVDVGTIKLEHDVNQALSLRNQFRYASYTRSFQITEPQIDIVGTNTPLLIPFGGSLNALTVTRNLLMGSSDETFLEDQADATYRFGTGPINHTLVAGVEIGKETSDPIRFGNSTFSTTPLTTPNPNVGTGSKTFLSSITKSSAFTAAAYAIDTLSLGDQWDLIAGTRYDHFDADFSQQTFNAAGALTANTNLSHVNEMVSWRGALVFKPSDKGSVYFGYGTSFNPSAEAISLTVATADLAPVKNKSYELGTKWDVFDRSLSLRAAIYRTEQTNARETDPTNALFQILAGHARVDGIELEAAGHLTEAWQIYSGYAYMYGIIDESPNNDLGNRLANVPRHTANLWTTYDLPGGFQIGGGANYVSARFASATPTTVGGVNFLKRIPGYVTYSAMGKYSLTEHVDLQVNIYNLLDKYYYDEPHPNHIIVGGGRTALFTTNFRF
jgi:catecholate siderophore receptor